MNRVLMIASIVPSICGIIVRDSPTAEGDIHYNYSYDIEDPTTGDSKSQHEVRTGDVVTGAYSVLDPDGTKRTVKYTADPRNGFKAVIHTVPVAINNRQEAVLDNYVPTDAARNYVPQQLYTRVISAPAQENFAIPFYPLVKQPVEEGRRVIYFNPVKDKKMILRDSLGPDKYFEPSSNYQPYN